MKDLNTQVRKHYHHSGLYEKIIDQLARQQLDVDNLSRTDFSGVDEFHIRGAEVSRELAEEAKIEGARLLDVGCGIGGPCRMLADQFNCQTTGIDASAEFIRTARLLSERVGLQDQTTFIQGDALHLPFAEASFDVVWTQHVQMNIEDKNRFYSEIGRVLQKGGTFIYYDLFRAGAGNIHYPVPWADSPEISFLAPVGEIDELLLQLGFKQTLVKDLTQAGIKFFEKAIARTSDRNLKGPNLSLLMGKQTGVKIGNLLRTLQEGTLMLQSGIYTL